MPGKLFFSQVSFLCLLHVGSDVDIVGFPVVMYFFQKLPYQQRFQNINSTSTFLLFSGRYSLIVYSQEEGRLSYINLDQYKVFICSNQKSRQIFPPFIFSVKYPFQLVSIKVCSEKDVSSPGTFLFSIHLRL